MSPRIYLASTSPRRRELLRQIGVQFDVLTFRSGERGEDADVDETPLAGEAVEHYVERLALAKAEAGVESKAEVSPTVSGHLNPGKVTNVALATMPVNPQYMRAAGGFSGAHLQVNGCGGPVSIRSYVQIATISPTSTDTVAVYGDPQRIR